MSAILKWRKREVPAWAPLGRLYGLRNELDRFFEGSLNEFARGAELLRTWNPAMDVHEDKDNVYVKAELPGLDKKDIDVSIADGVLSVSGERKSEEKSEGAETYRSERFVGRFHRSITLPSQVKSDQVQAQYKDGVLTITLPKAEEARRKQIEVKVS